MVPYREKEFTGFFRKKDTLVYCTDVQGLIEAFGMLYQGENWRLFTKLSKISMKAVLLFNGPSVPSISVAHSVMS